MGKEKNILRYSIQLALLKKLLSMELLSEYEFDKIKADLMKDYGVISHYDTKT